jgi:tetratricopeptide (TPR) repeat protein
MTRANEVRKDAIQAHELEIRKADVLRQLGGANVADALKLVSKGLLRDPLSERGRSELAEIHMKLWQYDEALNAWEHTLWLKPNDPYVHFKLGMCHWWRAQGSGSRAEAAASRAQAAEFMDLSHHLFSREDVTGRSWLRLWRGRVALERGLRDDAIMHLRAARSYPGGAPVARTFLGEAYLDGEQFTLAAEEFGEALRVTADLAPGDLVDARWGDSVSASHLRARCHCGTAAAYVEAGHPAVGFAAAERAISAAAGIDAPEERAKAKALGLITKARAVMDGAGDERDRETALVNADELLAEAVALHPRPDACLHRAQIRELLWEVRIDPAARRRMLTDVEEFALQIVRLEGGDEMARKAADIEKRLDAVFFAVPVAVGNGSNN